MDKNLGDGTISGSVANLGTVGTNVTAVEHGDSKNHITKLTLASVAVTVGDNAALGVGALIYTFPAGAVYLQSTHGSLAMTMADSIMNDTPEMGIGTVIASGANATLGAVGATSEDIAGPVVLTDTDGTVSIFEQHTVGTLVIAAAAVHTVFINFADTWANVSDTDSTISGTVWLNWTLLN